MADECSFCAERRSTAIVRDDGVSVKPGLWTGLDYGLDYGLDWTGLG